MDIGISEKAFIDIKKKFGDHASWAVWSEPQSGNWSSKEDVGDLSVFNDKQILKELNPNIVFLSICRSREYEVTINPPAWLNFHDGRRIGQDYKLRYALHGTPFWGSYITNLVVTEICEHGSRSTFNDACYQSLVNELRELPAREPLVIVALGTSVYQFLTKQRIFSRIQQDLSGCRIFKMTHYSSFINPGKYAEEAKQLANAVF